MTTIHAYDGPNLDMLGIREPEIYGTDRLEQLVHDMAAAATRNGMELVHHQTNHEGDLVGLIHEAVVGDVAGIIINPGAFTHYAWSIHDALASFAGPIIEVHLTNPAARESWRHTSVVAPVATATIAGLGAAGMVMAVDALSDLLA